VSTQPLVLVADDEPRITKLVSIALGEEGFRVVTANGGEEALAKAEEVRPDIVLLDIVMPDLDGIEVMRQLRERRPVPVILLTAKGSTADKAKGLDLGADDYIAKPFSPREVVLRIKAVLRRRQGAEEETDRIEIGRVRIDTAAHRALVRGNEIPLTATEFRLLRVLMERQGRVQTRSRLLTDVWGYAEDVDSRTVDTHVRRLRRKLGPEADRIETVIGVGYRMRG
jgi:two-component system phosphate regulon response regulator PhoB